MISWRSCSSRGLPQSLAPIALLLGAALVSCRHAPPPAAPSPRIAVFPVQNVSGGTAPVRPLTEALEAALAGRGLDIVPRKELDELLARHRFRYTAGVDRPTAKALREEAAVDLVIVPTLEQYSAEAPPKVALAVRIVEASDRPTVLWAESASRSGDDSPGLLGMGLVGRSEELERTVVATVARSVDKWVRRRAPGDECSAGRFGPRRFFRAPELDDVGRRSVAVLPFANATARRGAGEVLVGQFVAQLARSGSFEVLDPGVVREELLAHRIVLEGGVSVDTAMILLDLLGADLVLAGDVNAYTGPASPIEPPSVEFNAFMLDLETGEMVWSSSSSGAGNDGVFFFGAGRVYTSSALSCRMVRAAVDRIVGERGPLGPVAPGVDTRPQGLRSRYRMAQYQRWSREASARNSTENPPEGRARPVNHRRGSPDSPVRPQETQK